MRSTTLGMVLALVTVFAAAVLPDAQTGFRTEIRTTLRPAR